MPRERDPDEPKIYFLPNLMTACNLACGFFAVLMIFKGLIEVQVEMSVKVRCPPRNITNHAKPYYEYAILLIFGSCLFDLLDGRLARLGGQESPFGQEFDSLADIISFGMAPAMLLSKRGAFPAAGQHRLGDRPDLSGLRRDAAGAIQLPRLAAEKTRRFHRFPRPADPDGRGFHRLAHVPAHRSLSERPRTRNLEIRARRGDARAFPADDQRYPLPELQESRLADPRHPAAPSSSPCCCSTSRCSSATSCRWCCSASSISIR